MDISYSISYNLTYSPFTRYKNVVFLGNNNRFSCPTRNK